MHQHAPVSVVIPSFNSSSVLERALESVTSQTQPVGEVLVVDDCSNRFELSKTNSITAEFRRHGLPVTVVALDRNVGPGSARNAGWDLAQEEYVAFLDADDMWHPQKIALQYDFMSSNPETDFSSHRRSVNVLPTTIYSATAHRISTIRWLSSCRASTSTVMIKRNIGERFPLGERYSEDYELWLTLVMKGKEYRFIDAELCRSFKAPYGASGLSADLWEMEKGELRALRSGLASRRRLSLLYPLVSIYSVLKYLNRLRAVIANRSSRTAAKS